MADDDSGVVSTEIEPQETDRTDVAITRKHATLDWLSGYAEGERRGIADVLDSLSIVLTEAGLQDRDVEIISLKILERSGRASLFR